MVLSLHFYARLFLSSQWSVLLPGFSLWLPSVLPYYKVSDLSCAFQQVCQAGIYWTPSLSALLIFPSFLSSFSVSSIPWIFHCLGSGCFVFDSAILGLTVVAIGDSLGDFIADTSVARAGLTDMALASTFGSPLFNEVFGLSFSFLIGTILSYPNPFVVVIPSLMYYCWGFLGLSLISSLVLFLFFRYKPPSWCGAYLILLYIGFVIVNITLQAG